MIYSEEEYLSLSGIQHFAFCRRQWALIYLEQQWAENFRTVDGEILHEHAHDPDLAETRKGVRAVRGLRVQSAALGVSGNCDVVEWRADADGVPLIGYPGLWQPYPVEYKRGRSKETDADRLQLCGQAMCLEEMLCCTIPEGALYYKETRHREQVPLTTELRETVRTMLAEMHSYQQRGITPRVKTGAHCRACSLQELCLPKLCKKLSAKAYIRAALETEEP